MKTLILLAAFIISFSAQAQVKTAYQVIEPHPEEVRRLLPYVQTQYQGGRLWIVNLKSPGTTPSWVFKMIRPANSKYLRHYDPNQAVMKNFELPPIDTNFLKAVSLEGMKTGVEKISSFKNRGAGNPDNVAAQKWIQSQLSALGYDVKLDCYQEGACSVIADKKGNSKPDEVILVEGHFDSVNKDFAGADDNGTGTISTLEIARVLKTYNNKRTIRFFLTNGEELGLYGAEHYSKVLLDAGQIKNLKLVINMDMVGYNSNGIVELETDAPWNALAQWFVQLTEKYTTLKTKITLGAWGSDHVPFLQKGVPTLLTIEYWDTKTPCYHQGCDKPDTVNYTYMTEITKLNTAAVLSKDVE